MAFSGGGADGSIKKSVGMLSWQPLLKTFERSCFSGKQKLSASHDVETTVAVEHVRYL